MQERTAELSSSSKFSIVLCSIMLFGFVFIPCAVSQTARPRAKLPTLNKINSDVENAPGDAFVWYKRAEAEANGLEDRKAIVDYTKAIALNKSFAGAYFKRGHSYGNLGDFKNAESDFRQALDISINSKNPLDLTVPGDAAAALTTRMRSRGETDAILQMWDRVVKFSNQPLDFFRRGEFELSIGKLNAAEADLKLGLRERETNVENLRVLGECQFQEGRTKDAIQTYTTAIDYMLSKHMDFSIRKRFRLYVNRAQCYRKLGQVDLAKADEKKVSQGRDSVFELIPFQSLDK